MRIIGLVIVLLAVGAAGYFVGQRRAEEECAEEKAAISTVQSMSTDFWKTVTHAIDATERDTR